MENLESDKIMIENTVSDKTSLYVPRHDKSGIFYACLDKINEINLADNNILSFSPFDTFNSFNSFDPFDPFDSYHMDDETLAYLTLPGEPLRTKYTSN